MKVCKFGGTSMADAAAINNVASIINADAERKFVVVSAPGKRFSQDVKVTDMLLKSAALAEAGESIDGIFGDIKSRFVGIISDLGLKLDLGAELDKIKTKIVAGAGSDYAASRGEYLSARVMAARLGFDFVDAGDIIKFASDGTFSPEYTNDVAARVLGAVKVGAVIPGFYGRMPDGTIKTFSRGGSDVSGAIVARAVKATVYENWTDVSGFMVCDPKIVKGAATIDRLTYKELRELSYMGASVLHPDSIFPVRKSDIPINIKNTFAPLDKGTMIVPSKTYQKSERVVTGIAGKKDFVAIHIEKSMMNSELGFARRALSVLEHYGISVEHMPSGIDTMSLVVEQSNLKGNLDAVLERLRSVLNPDGLEVVEGLSFIATVGHGMNKRSGTAGRLFGALAKAKVNVRMIDQGSSELNIIVAVDNSDFEKAIQAIYDEFVSA